MPEQFVPSYIFMPKWQYSLKLIIFAVNIVWYAGQDKRFDTLR